MRQACAATRVAGARGRRESAGSRKRQPPRWSVVATGISALGRLRDCILGAQSRQRGARELRDPLEESGAHRDVETVHVGRTEHEQAEGGRDPRRPAAAALRDSARKSHPRTTSPPRSRRWTRKTGRRMLLVSDTVSAVTGLAHSSAAYCGLTTTGASAQCGTLKTFFIVTTSVSGSRDASLLQAAALGSRRTSRDEIASFSWAWRTMSATRDSSALMRSRSISDWRSTSEIAWPLWGCGNCSEASSSGCWSKKSGC